MLGYGSGLERSNVLKTRRVWLDGRRGVKSYDCKMWLNGLKGRALGKTMNVYI
jgi:hypothetical protein